MKQFNDLKRKEQEAYLMLSVINTLKTNGGKGTTTDIKKTVIKNDDYLPEDALTTTITSQKGNTYHPFDYPYNFAVTNLEMANLIKRPRRGYIVLNKEGYDFQGSREKLANIVYSRSLTEWEKRKERNKVKRQKNNNAGADDIEESVEDNTSQEDRNTAKITNAINSLSPQKFETFCRALMTKMNVDIDEKIGVSLSNDGGLDGFGYMLTDDFRTTRVAIQAKHWSNNLVSSPEIDKFRGAMDKYRAEYGVFITTSNFTRSAIQAARTGSRVITLIDGDQLTKLVIKYQLYVKPVTIYELDEDFFGNGKD